MYNYNHFCSLTTLLLIGVGGFFVNFQLFKELSRYNLFNTNLLDLVYKYNKTRRYYFFDKYVHEMVLRD